ncbi:MAG: Rrf2 family transcriptional regulator [Bacteroidetes bacterium]|nr:Rrf2 family transcriptional regulator [Bacteroidota bacterium]MBS1756487.1 Rrf2 family transcriptional regulator [Bacteroidota bacterium]
MFSKTCEYAIRAMIYIAHTSRAGQKAGIKQIAAGIDSPEHFIAKILQDLSRKRLVQSLKGPNGGFYLDEMSKNRSLLDVVRSVDGDSFFSACCLGLKHCSESHPCPVHHEFKKIRQQTHDMLANAKLTELSVALENEIIFLKRK